MLFQILKRQSAEESDMQTKKNKQSLMNGIAIPFEEANEMLDVDWNLDTFKLVASFFNKRGAEGKFVYTGNMDNDEEISYFDMVFRIMEAFVVSREGDSAFPPSVLIRILSNSENKCFLECVLSFTPDDFSTLNRGEVFLPDTFKAIMDAAERRYSTL